MTIPFDKETLNQAQREVIMKNNLKSAYIRPMCFYGSEGMGLRADNLRVHVMIAAWEWGASKQKDLNNFAQKHMRLDSIPFSSETKMFVSLNKLDEENNIIYVNGAPEIVLEKTNLTDEKRLEVEKDIKHLTKRGQRVLGFAKKIISKSTTNLQKDGYEKDLEWVG